MTLGMSGAFRLCVGCDACDCRGSWPSPKSNSGSEQQRNEHAGPDQDHEKCERVGYPQRGHHGKRTLFPLAPLSGSSQMTDGALRGTHEVDGEVLPGTKTGQHLGMGQQSARGGARSLNIRTCIRRTRDGGGLVWARPVSCLRLTRNQGKAVPPAAACAALSEYA
jgi:hypothetical protein